MTAIVEKVLSLESIYQNAVSSYIDDLIVNTNVVSVENVRQHLLRYGLLAKDPIHYGCSDKIRVLGLSVLKDMTWNRDSVLPKILKNRLSRREVHSILGEWVGHYPVAGWLRVASSFIQRCTAQDCDGWDKKVDDEIMKKLHDVNRKLKAEGDPVRGRWPVDIRKPVVLWSDASAIALGVALEVDGDIIEDASWLRPKNDSAHINRSELDAVIRGLNMSIKWGFKEIRVMTDSATVFGWIRAIVEKSHNVKTSALSEILIRRRLSILKDVITENSLNIKVQLVRSEDNAADKLTRVPRIWLVNKPKDSTDIVCLNLDIPTDEELLEIHKRGHFGTERTLALAREGFGSAVSKKRIKRLVRSCEPCARYDPAVTNKWDRGKLQSAHVWDKLAVDITHVRNEPYLSIIDTSSRFMIWRKLRSESAREVCGCMEPVFQSLAHLMIFYRTTEQFLEVVNLLSC